MLIRRQLVLILHDLYSKFSSIGLQYLTPVATIFKLYRDVPNCQIVKLCIKPTELNVTNTARNYPSQFYIQDRQIVKLCINYTSYQSFILQFKHFVYSKIESINSYYNI